tara:strand:+ start:37 stop:741 length:705 start_codon:yes stop_codon:yes gene_type:complete
MNIIVFGGNSELGRQLIKDLENKQFKILSISRSENKILSEKIKTLKYNTLDEIFFKNYKKNITDFFLGKIDVIIYLPAIRDDELIKNEKILDQIENFFEINSLNFIKFLEYNILNLMIEKSHIIFTSTISVFLNLKKNTFYGSSKVLLEFYLNSLSLKHPNLNIVIYKLGFLDTSKNSKKKFFFPKTKLHKVSKYIIKGIYKHKGEKIYPFFWLFIKYLINIIPKRLIYFFYNK